MPIDWNVLGAVAQAVEALVVTIGGFVIIWQIRAMRLERIHKRWEALQWAQSLLAQQDDLADVFEIPLAGMRFRESWSIVRLVVGNWNLVGMAVSDGYVEKNLLFQLFGGTLAGAYRRYLEDAAMEKRPNLFITTILKAPANSFSLELLKAAYEWHEYSRPAFKDSDMERWFKESQIDEQDQ